MSPDHRRQELHRRLIEFRDRTKLTSKGRLSLVLTVTRRAMAGLPLDPDALVTAGGGQIVGVGMAATQKILADYGISKILSREGGRTSRKSILHARQYAVFLNELHADGLADLYAIEAWWVQRVRDFFAATPLRLERGPSTSMRSVVAAILEQAKEREIEAADGSTIVGTVLQFLVGAKLSLLDADGSLRHHAASVADSLSGRAGDFVLGGSAIHVTTAPGEAVIRRCHDNLSANIRPVLVTLDSQVPIAEEFARRQGIARSIDVLGATMFLGSNLLEASGFHGPGGEGAVLRLIDRYNDLIERFETDPSLRIDRGR